MSCGLGEARRTRCLGGLFLSGGENRLRGRTRELGNVNAVKLCRIPGTQFRVCQCDVVVAAHMFDRREDTNGTSSGDTSKNGVNSLLLEPEVTLGKHFFAEVVVALVGHVVVEVGERHGEFSRGVRGDARCVRGKRPGENDLVTTEASSTRPACCPTTEKKFRQ